MVSILDPVNNEACGDSQLRWDADDVFSAIEIRNAALRFFVSLLNDFDSFYDKSPRKSDKPGVGPPPQQVRMTGCTHG